MTVDDPYRFKPTMGELDLHLLGEGQHEGLWRHLGAHVRVHRGHRHVVRGLGAERAVGAGGRRLQQLDGRMNLMRTLGGSGVWEIFLPVAAGAHYKYEVLDYQGHLGLRADPFAFATEVPPSMASVVYDASYAWRDAGWLADREAVDAMTSPMSVYEVHVASWRQVEDGHGGWRPLTYRELADALPAYVSDLGFHPRGAAAGRRAPVRRLLGLPGDRLLRADRAVRLPDDFRYLVDRLHQAGIGVIVDWVVAHFPKDDWALARFDGTALYEHVDPRLSEHPDWGTLVFNYGRHEVRNFLLANAPYWIEEYHIDGLRVDAVASMLYLDYSRSHDQWVPNRFGGKENLEAIDFIKETNEVVYRHHPSVLLIAEESTSWPAVSRPMHLGGLGFGSGGTWAG